MEGCLDCKYVGSYGLLLSTDIHESLKEIKSDSCVIDGSHFINITKDNQVIHVCTQALKNFITYILPILTKPFLLVTNNSDLTVPTDIQDIFNGLVNHNLLIHWFAQNCVIDHEKLTRIPIGLDYHTLVPSQKFKFLWSTREICRLGVKMHPVEQESQLVAIYNTSLPFWRRKILCYSNFHLSMNNKNDRKDAYNSIEKRLVFYEPDLCVRIECWRNMINYAFVLSPHGNGLDCHRTWEALCLGCIPIVKSSGLDPLFEDLPVWIVNSWKDVTEENMHNKINEFSGKQYDYSKLTLKYWRDKIRA